MKKRFSSWLLMGKVATLPVLIQAARADVVPAYTDVIRSSVSVFVLPANQIALKTISADTASHPANAANSLSSTLLCTTAAGTTLPTTMSVVITGINAGESVYLVAALNKNDPLNLALDSRITVGTNGLVIMGSASLSGSSGTSSAVTIQVDLTRYSNLLAANRFYMQAVSVLPDSPVSSWRLSELDTVSVGIKQFDSYGVVTAYCT